MVLEIQNQQYYQYTDSTPKAGNQPNGNDSVNIPIGQTTQVNNTSNTNPTETLQVKRTIEDLYILVCKETGLNFDKVKSMGLLSLVSGKSEEELINLETVEFNKIVEEIKNAINAIREDIFGIDKKSNNELDLNLVLNYTRLLKGEVPKGWDSVESFRIAQKGIRYDKNGNPIGSSAESLSQRLKVMYGIDIKTLSKEELAQGLEDYFYGYFNKQKDLGKTDAEIKDLQLTDFSKLLFNSTPEEYNMFRDAIEYLLANNRAEGYRGILDSFVKEEDKIKFNNETTEEQEMTWATKVGQDGVAPTKEDAQAIHLATSEYKDTKDLESGHISLQKRAKDFYTKETLSKLEEIKSKSNNNEALTAEEKELFIKDQALRGFLNAENISVGTNKIISNEDRIKLAKMFNLDLANLSKTTDEKLYTEVMDEVSKYIEKHKETLAISEKDFTEIINDAKTETLAKKEDISNSTIPNAEIKTTPDLSQGNDSAKTTKEPDLGYKTPEKKEIPSKTDVREKTARLYSSQPDTPTVIQEIRTSEPIEKVLARGNADEIIDYVRTKTEEIAKVLSENLSSTINDACFKLLSTMNDNKIANFCNRIKHNGNKILAMEEISSASVLEKVKCNNAAVEDAKQKYLKELQENTV